MFTGIIEEVGSVSRVETRGNSARLVVAAKTVLENTKIGDSIAVNGVCLTVVACDSTTFSADVSFETLTRTTLGSLGAASKVNLERAMLATSRFGGHIVTGHIDCRGRLLKREREGNSHVLTFAIEPAYRRFLVEKGSIAIDGISLTIANVTSESFTVAVIPHTFETTTLKTAGETGLHNIECDIIGKYVARLLKTDESFDIKADKANSFGKPQSELTLEFLTENGF